MRMRVAIVDDEPLAREGVALSLRSDPDVEVVASCADGTEAVRAIRELSPDLVFLDVRMPGLSGFDVIEEVGVERMPAVIFLTAYEQHALDAFRVNAVDYLLKPLEQAKLAAALARARRDFTEQRLVRRANELVALLDQFGANAAAGGSRAGRILVRAGANVHILKPDEIIWVEAEGDYVTLHTGEQSHLLSDSLRNMETRLAPHGFVQIHRSCLVSMQRVRKLLANENGDYQAILDNGTRLKVGRRYKDALFAALDAQG
jgi:two-component system, LytTR family, response regulator